MTVQSNDQEVCQSSMQSQETNMMSELERLQTFTSWPGGNTQSAPSALARSGFMYSGQGYKVTCPMCGLRLDYSEYANCPDEEHRKRSPHCQLASQVPTANEILPSVTSNLPEAQSNTKALMDVYEAALKRSTGESEITQQSSGESVLVDHENPNPELLRWEKHRLETFFDWPLVANARPGPLAREGFFYTGLRDRVCCIFCHNILHSWENGDDPKEEHRKYFPNCPFVREQDVGNIRIEEEFHPEDTAQAQAQAPVASSIIEQNTEGNDVVKRMGSAPVSFEQSLMEENNRLKEARTCKVCMDKEVNTVFLPCGHLICCDFCSPRVKNCPLCRTYIKGTVKTFLS